MNHPTHAPGPVPDEDLVALVHGELDADAARTVRARLAADPEARARHTALAATDAALREALDTHSAPSASPRRDWLRPLFAAAAVLVVAMVFVFQRSDRDEAVAGRNEFLELKVEPRYGASHPLFTRLEFALHWKSLGSPTTWRYIKVVPYGFGDSPEELAKEAYSIETHGKILPVVVTAALRAPDGTVIEARLRHGGKPPLVDFYVAGGMQLIVTQNEFEVQVPEQRLYLGGGPVLRGWESDFMWPYRNLPRGKQARWFPEQPGEWRIELRVDSLPPPQPGAWPTFREPLVVKTAVVLTAEVSPWSEPHDGLQARLVLATGGADLDHTPIAAQLRNQSGRTRKYNVTGTTMAPIPQPFHFDMVVDGEDWKQRDGIAVITDVEELMLPHENGTIRTLVVMPDYWRRDGKSLGQLATGRHQVQLRFHFEPSVWDGADKELWMGELLTPPLPVELPKR